MQYSLENLPRLAASQQYFGTKYAVLFPCGCIIEQIKGKVEWRRSIYKVYPGAVLKVKCSRLSKFYIIESKQSQKNNTVVLQITNSGVWKIERDISRVNANS